MKYDFSVLSDYEFEKLVNKLLSKKNIVVEQYRSGKDQGFDGFSCEIPINAMIQAKHYVKSDYATLKRKIENEELAKIQKAKPFAYVLATSYNLTHAQSAELRSLIETAVKEVVVLGYESVSSLLDSDSNTLKSMVKLWCGNAEIARHVLNPECMSKFIILKSRIDKIDEKFVETPSLNDVRKILSKEHVAVIAGEPGVGKTSLAEYLCFLYLSHDFDVEIFEGDFTREHYDLSNPSKKVLYYFDDFLGSNYLNCISDKSDSAIVRFIEQIQKEPNKRLILTSRTLIVNKAQEYSQSYRNYGLSKKQYIVDVGKYDELTKAKILCNHLKFCDLELNCIQDVVGNKEYKKIINHKNFNPRLIEFITRKENFEGCGLPYISFVRQTLDNPREIWEHCFTAQLNAAQRLLVKLVVANQGFVGEDELKPAYVKALKLFNIPRPEQERIDYEYVLKICERCILKRTIECYHIPHKIERAVVSVFNPSVSDYVLPLIFDDINELEILCDSLRTAGSFLIFARIEENERKKMMHRLLAKYSDEEWPLIRVWMIGALGNLEYAGIVFNAINKGYLKIDPDNWNCLQSIIIFSVDSYDWSNVLMNVDVKVYNSLEDYDVLYESYKNCQHSQESVLYKLHDNIVSFLKSNVDRKLLERFDCSREIDESDLWNEYADYSADLVEKLPFLDENDFDLIAQGINSNWIVEEVESTVRENLANDYYDEDDDRPVYNVNDEINEMFLNLIKKGGVNG